MELGVNDTGMGIPRDKQQEIYTRFTRITPSYQGIYPGTGLGLSVVKQFIDEMGGEIQLDSRPNQGSTFTCFIPLQEALSPARDEYETDETLSFSKDAAARTQKVNEVSELPEMPVTGSRVLVVEDNAIAAKVAQNVLSNLNCSIDIAPDGKTALTSIEKNHYELILMDIGLPNDDGYDVTRRIRLKQWQRNSLVPIIGLTAHVDEEKKRCCLENGMNAIYNKPLTPERASEILHVFLSHSQTLTPTSKEKHDELSNNQLHALPLLDKKKAIRLLGTDETFQELLELLVSGLTKEIAALKQYHQDTDWQSIRALAHKWEGGTNYCGASRLEHACKEIRRTLRMPEKSEIMYQTLLHVAEETNKAAREILEKE
nr:response regulator [Rickettsiella grylli]